jgi:MOSC domain-containing protein YiiM
MPKVVSLRVSRAKAIKYQGDEILTGIYKEPVEGRIALKTLNLDGDEQADLTVHGGIDKAVYAYPSEHYPWWRQELPETQFEYGAFGENLTTEGLFELDEFRVGTAVIRVSQPRLPCYKLAIKIGRDDIVKRFVRSARSGIYFSVVEEGTIANGDEITYLRGDGHKVTVLEVAAAKRVRMPRTSSA